MYIARLSLYWDMVRRRYLEVMVWNEAIKRISFEDLMW